MSLYHDGWRLVIEHSERNAPTVKRNDLTDLRKVDYTLTTLLPLRSKLDQTRTRRSGVCSSRSFPISRLRSNWA